MTDEELWIAFESWMKTVNPGVNLQVSLFNLPDVWYEDNSSTLAWLAWRTSYKYAMKSVLMQEEVTKPKPKPKPAPNTIQINGG